MHKYYRCEYCGRKILTEVCRYCGGINSFEHMTPLEPQKKKNPTSHIRSETGKNGKQTASFFKRGIKRLFSFITRRKGIFLLLTPTVLLAIMLGCILYDAEIVWDAKENTKTDNILLYDSAVELSFTYNNNTGSITLPCRFSEISEKYKIINPTIAVPDRNDPDRDGIFDLEPNDYCIASDTYGIFCYYVTNDSEEKAPYLDGACSKLVSGDNFKNCTSLKYNGTELLTDIDTIIASYGEPSRSDYGSLSSTYTYNTKNGYISLKYLDEKDTSRPNHIEICQKPQS